MKPNFYFENYIFKHKPQILAEGEIAKGGVGTFIRNYISFSEININTIFQAILFNFSYT